MDKKVEQAMQAALKQFAKVSRHDTTAFTNNMRQIFNGDKHFLEKVEKLDSCFDHESQLESLHEIFFDLLLINFFSQDLRKLEGDYLESKEWEAIEEETLDRGTEILNMLLYLRECGDEGIAPELNDYLNEFLLVDEDEFQDEHIIYEDVISNQLLIESSFEEIAKVANGLSDSSQLKELFYPLMSFFNEPNPSEDMMDNYATHSSHPEFDTAVYALLTTYNQTNN
jgi:hypothetical protein